MNIEEQLGAMSIQKAAVIGLVVAVFYFFALYNDGSGLEKKLSTRLAKETSLRTELVDVENRRKEALRIKAALADIGKKLDDLVRFLPTTLRSSDFMKMLSDEAQAAGVNILSIDDQSMMAQMNTSGQEVGSEFFVKIPVRIKLEGTYVGLLTFLSNLTKIDKIILLNDIEISKSSGIQGPSLDPNSGVMLTMAGNVVAFRYNEPEPDAAEQAGQ